MNFQPSRRLMGAAPDLRVVPAQPSPRIYRCRECKTVTKLSGLNMDMLCEACGTPEDDQDYAPSEAYLRKWEGTWSI